jgi:hypothetical protein
VLQVLNVQRQLIAIAQQQTQAFKPALAAPLYDSHYISHMEEYVGAIFPIDFMLFLQNLAQCLTNDCDPLLPTLYSLRAQFLKMSKLRKNLIMPATSQSSMLGHRTATASENTELEQNPL